MKSSNTTLPAFDGFIILIFILLSIPIQAAAVILGDFEGHMDGWTPVSGASVAFSTERVTQGTASLEVVFPSGWKSILKKDMRSQLELLQTMTSFSLDVTTRNDGGQIPGGLSLFFVINSETGGWQQFSLSYPGVPSSPRTDTLTVTIPQGVRDNFIENGTGSWGEFFIITNSGGGIAWFDHIHAVIPDPPTHVTIQVNADSPIRTIPMTLYGANLQSWDWHQDGTWPEVNNLLIASGRKYFRVPGGSWSNGHLWSDIEEINSPYTSATWKVSYEEYLFLMSQLSQPGEAIAPTLQPIVNFPGCWYGYTDENGDYQTDCHGHPAAVDAAVAWVQDQTARDVCAEYWEIGNEIGGPWEVGYFPEITGTYYGDYFADFFLAMKAVNPGIKIGACAEPKHELQEWGWYQGYWTYDTLAAAAAKNAIPDFLIIHQYPASGKLASYNSTLLADRVDDIAHYTANLDGIVENALGAPYIGQIRYAMTEWDAGGHDDYDRVTCYVNALFHAQYILEMARHDWDVSTPWVPEYDSNFSPHPVWYVNPLLVHYFGRDMVAAASSDAPLVRAYAAHDADGNLTLFMVNNSPTDTITADVSISGFSAGSGGQQWLVEPAGALIDGGVTIQDSRDISVNGVVDPHPLTAPCLPSHPFTAGNTFTTALPASSMLLLKIPAGTGDTTSPAAPTGLTAALDGLNVELDWNDSAEGDLKGYNLYRSTISGNGYSKQNGVVLIDSHYTDTMPVDNETYYYVVTAVDTSWNESGRSNEAAITIPLNAIGTILYERWSGITGASVADLTSNAAYPDNPSFTDSLTKLEGPTDLAENYGTRIRGYLYPPATGSYTFWIAGDDNCQLWLSSDGTPANAALIATVPGWTNSHEWDKYASQESSPIALTAMQKYYIDVLHKENTGGDTIAVAWSGPAMSQRIIDGEFLSPWLTGMYGNFNGVDSVSIDDMALLAGQWLSNNCVLTSSIDLNGDCIVDFYEFSAFAQNWMN